MKNHLDIKTLGIVAPASGFERSRFDKGLSILKDFGFRVRVDERVFAKTGYLAGSDEERAALLMELFADDGVDAVMCARGGYGCMRLLPLLDLDMLARSSKPLIGFSDCTALFCALYDRGAHNCWHGPVVTQMGDLSGESLGVFNAALRGDNLVYEASHGKTLREGCISAPVFGGNLAVLVHMAGTPYFPDLKSHILFLEEQNEPLYKVDRMFTQLKLVGVLDGLAGIVLGEFINCGEVKAVYARLLELLGDKDIPVLADFPSGHGCNNMMLPLGAIGTLDSAARTLIFDDGADDAAC